MIEQFYFNDAGCWTEGCVKISYSLYYFIPNNATAKFISDTSWCPMAESIMYDSEAKQEPADWSKHWRGPHYVSSPLPASQQNDWGML